MAGLGCRLPLGSAWSPTCSSSAASTCGGSPAAGATTRSLGAPWPPGRLALAAQVLGANRGLTDTLGYAALAVWLAAMAWLPALLLGEVRWPRLTYDVRRWSTVFPVGMYAACSFVTGRATHITALLAFAGVWVWFGLMVWVVVVGAMLRRGVPVAGGGFVAPWRPVTSMTPGTRAEWGRPGCTL